MLTWAGLAAVAEHGLRPFDPVDLPYPKSWSAATLTPGEAVAEVLQRLTGYRLFCRNVRDQGVCVSSPSNRYSTLPMLSWQACARQLGPIFLLFCNGKPPVRDDGLRDGSAPKSFNIRFSFVSYQQRFSIHPQHSDNTQACGTAKY